VRLNLFSERPTNLIVFQRTVQSSDKLE